MPLNTTAIQDVIDELKQRIADDTSAIATFERLIAHAVPAKAVEKKKPGRKPKVEVVASVGPVKKTYAKVCDKHGKYSASGPRGNCPACNPRTVTAKEAFAR